MKKRKSLIKKVINVPVNRVIGTMLIFFLHLFGKSNDYDFFEGALAGFCSIVVFNILWNYFLKKKYALPVLEWVSFQCYVFFAFPVFFEGISATGISFVVLQRSGAIMGALISAILFIVSLVCSWSLFVIRKREEKRRRIKPLSITLVLVYGIASIILGFFFILNTESRVTWYRYPLNLIFSAQLAQILLLFHRHHWPKARFSNHYLIILTSFMVVQGLFLGRISFALLPIITAAIAILVARARLPRSLIAISIILLIALNPAKLLYRQMTGFRTTQYEGLAFGDMASAWKEGIENTWSGGEKERALAYKKTASRINFITTNAQVIAMTPKIVPYEYWRTWLVIPYSLVPRVIWQEKPDLKEITNDRFAIEFDIQSKQTTDVTSSAYPVVAAGYWNLGYIGVIIAGIIAGIFWKSIFIAWDTQSRFRYVIAFSFLIGTQAIGALPLLIIGVLQKAIAYYIVIAVMQFFTKSFRRNAFD